MTFPLAPILGLLDGSFWMPKQASTVAPEVDWLFMFIMWITVFFFALIAVLMVIFVLKYRWRPGRDNADPVPAHSTALEITWTIIPTIIVLFIFYWGFKGFLNQAVPPPNAMEIGVQAQQWNWSFSYPDGFSDKELHVPINQPVKLVMTSSDVIHSLYFPQFRTKKDVVPGRFNYFWFTPTVKGNFDIYCTEYCGTSHSTMLSRVYVEEPEDYKKWLDNAKNWEGKMSPVEAGHMLMDRNGCFQCHSVDGTIKNCPTFKDLFGDQVPLSDGTSVKADEQYVLDSIWEPAKQVVKGYPVLMSSYKGRLKQNDVGAIIAYMKTISSHYQGPSPALANPSSTSAPATQQSATNVPTTLPQTRQ